MKNKKGFSFKEMIIIMILFLIILAIIFIKIHVFYKKVAINKNNEPLIVGNEDDNESEEKEVKKEDYYDLEQVLVDACSEYINDNNITSSTTVNSDKLIEDGYLSSTDILDLNDKTPCTGSVEVKITEDTTDYIPHLYCENYKSEDYE